MSHEETVRMERVSPEAGPLEVGGGVQRTELAPSPPLSGAMMSPGIAPEEEPIRAALSDRDYRLALSLCARIHGTKIGRFCMALTGSQAEADDLVQETLLAAHDAFASYRGDSPIVSWLLGIARLKCARHLERRSLRAARLTDLMPPDAVPEGLDLLADRRRAERTRSALAAVRPSEREAVLLRYLGELSYQEVGRACGIDERAARKRVSRALAQLRTVLSKEE